MRWQRCSGSRVWRAVVFLSFADIAAKKAKSSRAPSIPMPRLRKCQTKPAIKAEKKDFPAGKH
eukprot:5652394-Lingulodinium_polyedra.AAC.1